MTKKIEFAEGLSLPDDAATQTIAFIARKRAGKSYAAGKLAEGLHANGTQFVVLDPVGNWYGLRVSANGKDEGLSDVIILGGLRGDIPLDPNSGTLIADAVLDSGRSFVLDVSQFSLGERKRFVTAFGEHLWKRQKGLSDPQPIHVFLEEAQLFLPQQPMPDDRHMLGIWTEIIRLGGNKGIGSTMITQRPQSVAKEALTQVECLVVLQVSGVPEKKALNEWIVAQVDDKVQVDDTTVPATDLLKELPFLKQGVAYIWSPQWLEHFGKHAIGKKWTYDAGATPKVGGKKVQAVVKPIDLEKLREQMASTVQKLEENDPKALKKKVAFLEGALKKIAAAPQKVQIQTVAEPKIVEVPVLKDKELKLLEKQQEKAALLAQSLIQVAQIIVTEMNVLAEAMKLRFAVPPPKIPLKIPPPLPRPSTNGHSNGHSNGSSRHEKRVSNFGTIYKKPPEVEEGDQKLAKGAREMLRALACRHPLPLSRGQVATLAGISPRSSTFRNYSSILRVADYMNEDGAGLHITEKGLEYLGDDIPTQPTTTEELMSLWASKFTGKVNEMLRVLVESHPSSLSKEQLGEKVGILPETSTFRNYLSMLRSNELVETSAGEIRASDTLFPN